MKRTQFYGNKRSKVVHCVINNDRCRTGQIAPKNRVNFKTFMEAYDQDYQHCQSCHPEEHGV